MLRIPDSSEHLLKELGDDFFSQKNLFNFKILFFPSECALFFANKNGGQILMRRNKRSYDFQRKLSKFGNVTLPGISPDSKPF